MNNKKLIKACKNRDRKAQEILYRNYSPRFFTICLKYSNDYEQAKDNLQDGFIKIFQNMDQFSGIGSFEGWMTRIMINTSIKKFNDKSIFLSINEEITEDPAVEIDEDYLSVDDLIEMIQDLSPKYRIVFNLYVMEGYSHKKIAKLLKISEGTSKSNLSRARLKLKQKIESLDEHKMAPRL